MRFRRRPLTPRTLALLGRTPPHITSGVLGRYQAWNGSCVRPSGTRARPSSREHGHPSALAILECDDLSPLSFLHDRCSTGSRSLKDIIAGKRRASPRCCALPVRGHLVQLAAGRLEGLFVNDLVGERTANQRRRDGRTNRWSTGPGAFRGFLPRRSRSWYGGPARRKPWSSARGGGWRRAGSARRRHPVAVVHVLLGHFAEVK